MLIRTAREADERGIASMLRRCQPESLHLRFMAPVYVADSADRDVFDGIARAMISVHDSADVTLLVEGGTEVVAVAELRRRSGDEAMIADVALLVEDAHQRRGLGVAMVRRLVAVARSTGVCELRGDILGDNNRVLGVFRSAGLSPRVVTHAGVAEVHVPLHVGGSASEGC